MVKVATNETNPDGGGMVAPGRYLFTVNDIQPTEDSLKCEFSVMAGVPLNPQDGSQAGRTLNEYLKLFGKAASRLLQWACAVQLISKDQWRAARDQQAEIDFDEMQAIGRFFCGEVQSKPYAGKNEEHKGKEFPALDFRIWAIDDPAVIDIVSRPDAYAHVKSLLPPDHLTKHKPGAGGTGGASVPAKQPPKKPAPAAAAAPSNGGGDAFDMF